VAWDRIELPTRGFSVSERLIISIKTGISESLFGNF
jgi:hypothetical protein